MCMYVMMLVCSSIGSVLWIYLYTCVICIDVSMMGFITVQGHNFYGVGIWIDI